MPQLQVYEGLQHKENSSLDKTPNKLSHTTEKKNYTLYQSPDYMKLWRNREKNIDGVIKCLLGVI